jgi:hypothetical protein
LVSQWLTLYTTPVVYLYLERLASWKGSDAHIDATRLDDVASRRVAE